MKFNQLFSISTVCSALVLASCGSNDGAEAIDDISDLEGDFVVTSVTVEVEGAPIVLTRDSEPLKVRGRATLVQDGDAVEGTLIAMPVDQDDFINEIPNAADFEIELQEDGILLVTIALNDPAPFSGSIDGNVITLTSEDDTLIDGQITGIKLRRQETPVFPFEGSWVGTSWTVDGDASDIGPDICAPDGGMNSHQTVLIADFDANSIGQLGTSVAMWDASDECEGEPSTVDSTTEIGFFEDDGEKISMWLTGVEEESAVNPKYLEFYYVVMPEMDEDPAELGLVRIACSDSENGCTSMLPTQITLQEGAI